MAARMRPPTSILAIAFAAATMLAGCGAGAIGSPAPPPTQSVGPAATVTAAVSQTRAAIAAACQFLRALQRPDRTAAARNGRLPRAGHQPPALVALTDDVNPAGTDVKLNTLPGERDQLVDAQSSVQQQHDDRVGHRAGLLGLTDESSTIDIGKPFGASGWAAMSVSWRGSPSFVTRQRTFQMPRPARVTASGSIATRGTSS